MSDLPDYPMLAVLKDSVVVDCAFKKDGIIYSALDKKLYAENDGFEFVKVTVENSPISFGMKYKNNKFITKEK